MPHLLHLSNVGLIIFFIYKYNNNCSCVRFKENGTQEGKRAWNLEIIGGLWPPIINWLIMASNSLSVASHAVGTCTVMLQDSNLCG